MEGPLERESNQRASRKSPYDESQQIEVDEGSFPEEILQIKPIGTGRLNRTGQRSTASSSTKAQTPRLVRVSSYLFQQRPRRFRIDNFESQEAVKKPTEDPGIPTIPGGDDTHVQPTKHEASKDLGQQKRCELNRQSEVVLAPESTYFPQSLDDQPGLNISEVATSVCGKQSSTKPRNRLGYIHVNGVPYMRAGILGKGGSFRVYRVIDDRDVTLALKRVDIKNVDESMLRGYRSEIELLKTLSGVGRVVDLLNWELDSQKGILSLVMEHGTLDFESVLKSEISKANACLDLTYVRFYWKEMLECVAAVHGFNIVHSDLKPANFVVIGGCLKIIDFGIANLINDDTVNVHHDHQVGTPNYMAPESLLDISQAGQNRAGEPEKLIKVGKPSDIWSLGCILYQMAYGKAPFAHISNLMHRAMAIINPQYVIDYPLHITGGLKVPSNMSRTIRECLSWDQNQRPTAEDLLSISNKFLYANDDPSHGSEEFPLVNMSEAQLGAILRNVVRFCETTGTMPTKHEVEDWSKVFFKKLQAL